MEGKKIVHLNSDGDPAGVNWLLHRALISHGYKSRHILPANALIHPLQQGHDIIAENDPDYAKSIVEGADVLHVNQNVRDYPDIGYMPTEWLKDKPFIFHNHGGAVLLNPAPQLKMLRAFKPDVIYAACSPLTKHVIPECVWVINTVPLEDPLYTPVDRDFYEQPLMLCHKIFSEQSKVYKAATCWTR